MMHSLNSSSEVVENYLKAIYYLSREADDCTAAQLKIARYIGVSVSNVSKMLRSMDKSGLIDYAPYQPVKLTSQGEKLALKIIRHHRLLELYLVKTLGFTWDEVHREADRLEHHISEQMEAKIEALLGFPALDPHGDPIPTRDGIMPAFSSITLASQVDGSTVRISRVVDEDEALLRYLAAKRVMPGQALEVVSREPFGGSIILRIDGIEERITPQAAMNVFVEDNQTTGRRTAKA